MKLSPYSGRIALWTGCIAALIFLVAWLAGVFHPKVAPSVVDAPAEAPPSLDFSARVQLITEPQIERVPGTLTATRESTISPRITAAIAAIHVRAADSVSLGQTLVELDSRDLQARQRQADQSVVAAEARLTDARKNYERMQQLVGDGTIPRSQFDAAEAAFNAARADVERAQAAAREAGAWKSYATITAPFDGRIVDRYAEPGDTAMPGQAILKMYDPSRLRVEAQVRESVAGRLRPGQPLSLHIDALDRNIDGRVEEIVPQSEPGSRSVLVKVAIPDAADFYPGMFARLLIPLDPADRLVIPEAAVVHFGQLTYVWTREGDTAPTRRYVTLGAPAADGQVEILSGLTSGTLVGIRP
jgi:RND family efflux transporter MFP subunit